MMKTDIIDFGFKLPEERIAQRPAAKRGQARLLLVRRQTGQIFHHRFSDIPSLLPANSILILNDTMVNPCRLTLKKKTGGKVDLLLIKWIEVSSKVATGQALLKGTVKWKAKHIPLRCEQIEAVVTEKLSDGSYLVRMSSLTEQPVTELFKKYAKMPLPPYIHREPDTSDFQHYQTIFARVKGSIAAPTASLHFTKEIIEEIKRRGVQTHFITLHIGPATFKPIRTEEIENHKMGSEWFEIKADVAEAISRAKQKGKKIIAAGTSVVRALEGLIKETNRIVAWRGETSIFISPGHKFKVVDCMITNFHTPSSPPLSMVMAFAGIDLTKKAYREALEKNYRFYSYGDSMLII